MAVHGKILRASEEKINKSSFIAGKTGLLRNQISTEIENFFEFYQEHLSVDS
jgi:hypothetical protein